MHVLVLLSAYYEIDLSYMMDLVICHELDCCIREDADESGGVTLKEPPKAGLLVDIVSCAECTHKGP